MAKQFSLFREEVRRAWRELRGAELSPARAAAAVALGLFIGSQPIFGCHTPLVLMLCLWFRLDAAICWVAANISNPFFAPALMTAEVQAGVFLRTGSLIRMDREFIELGLTGFLKAYGGDLFLGAPLVGAVLALAGASLTFAGVAFKRRFSPAAPRIPYRLPDNAPPWIAAAERVALRYAPGDNPSPAQKTRFHYVRIKLITDPIAKLVANIEGEAPNALGEVLDIGTGAGQLPLMLLELGRAERVRGVDWDAAKIRDAKEAARAGADRGELASFWKEDARKAVYEPADTVLLIDLLHYFQIEEQNDILKRAAQAVRPGGRLLVREADTEQGLRSSLTRLEEAIFTTLRFNRGERVRFRPAREMTEILSGLGFICRIVPAWEGTPFSNVLIVANLPAESSEKQAGTPAGNLSENASETM